MGRVLAGDPAGGKQLAALVATVREVSAPPAADLPAVAAESAEERLRREVRAAHEIVGATAELPAKETIAH
jgi:hypothetical protein